MAKARGQCLEGGTTGWWRGRRRWWKMERIILTLPNPQVVIGSLALRLLPTAKVGRIGVEGLEML